MRWARVVGIRVKQRRCWVSAMDRVPTRCSRPAAAAHSRANAAASVPGAEQLNPLAAQPGPVGDDAIFHARHTAAQPVKSVISLRFLGGIFVGGLGFLAV